MSQYSIGRIPQGISNVREVPLEAAGSAREIADKVRQGKAFLKIVGTPWGVDFYVCEVSDTP